VYNKEPESERELITCVSRLYTVIRPLDVTSVQSRSHRTVTTGIQLYLP